MAHPIGNSTAANIIVNHDFSNGLYSWHPNCCKAFVVSAELGGNNYALVKNRTEHWQGLEQDVTTRISPGCTYSVSACVGVSGPLWGSTNVIATLRTSMSKGKWDMVEGTFSLSCVPTRIIFYLEGPPPGVELLIDSVIIHQSGNSAHNIVVNHDFSNGLHSWHPNCCNGFVVSVESNAVGLSPKSGFNYAVVKDRTKYWQGLEQDITSRISPGATYSVFACVAVSGPLSACADVMATLRIEFHGSATSYLFIGKTSVSKGKWEMVGGTFSLSTMPKRVIFYLEGPPPGVELIIDSAVISRSSSSNSESTSVRCNNAGDEIIINPQFVDGLSNWSGRGYMIVLHDSMADGKTVPQTGKDCATATERSQSWNGIQQEITGRVLPKVSYNVMAVVRIHGNNVKTATVQATLWVQTPDCRERYIGIAQVQATDKDWVQLQGKFQLNGSQSRVVIYLEGPPPGTDILVNVLSVKQAEKIPPSSPSVIEFTVQQWIQALNEEMTAVQNRLTDLLTRFKGKFQGGV